jgi:hypothetical protein
MRSAALLALVLLLPACYGDPGLPGDPPDETASTDDEAADPAAAGDRQGHPTHHDPTAQAGRIEELRAALNKLGDSAPDSEPDSRDGAASWRAAELAKVGELCQACCEAGSAPCRACLDEVVARKPPADELWSLYGLFMGALRPRAEDGAAVLAADLLLRPDPTTRDRAFRLAVGSGAARRGQPDASDRRASTIPIHPREGDRVVVIVELPASCPKVVTELKGPDGAGRIDLELALDCPEPEAMPIDEPSDLRATRAVWAFDVGPLPASGLHLFAGEEAPLLDLSPAGARPAPKD